MFRYVAYTYVLLFYFQFIFVFESKIGLLQLGYSLIFFFLILSVFALFLDCLIPFTIKRIYSCHFAICFLYLIHLLLYSSFIAASFILNRYFLIYSLVSLSLFHLLYYFLNGCLGNYNQYFNLYQSDQCLFNFSGIWLHPLPPLCCCHTSYIFIYCMLIIKNLFYCFIQLSFFKKYILLKYIELQCFRCTAR